MEKWKHLDASEDQGIGKSYVKSAPEVQLGNRWEKINEWENLVSSQGRICLRHDLQAVKVWYQIQARGADCGNKQD